MKKKSDELLVQDCERKIRSQTKSRKNGIVFFFASHIYEIKEESHSEVLTTCIDGAAVLYP